MGEQRKRGFSIKPEARTLIEKKMAEKGYNTREKLAEAAELSIDTVNRLFRGQKPQRKTIEAIARTLGLEPTDLVEQSEWYPSSPAAAQESAQEPIDINWRAVCRVMLKRQQEDQKLRRQATEIRFENHVHVPLGLVKRNQQQRRGGEIELNQIYQLQQEVIEKTYEHDDFLKEVIGQSQSSKNKQIAIVGEPGAGKTTLLGAIASFIKSKTEDLPICISLASLQGRTLKDYLLYTWLPEALGLVNPEVVVTPAIENQLIQRFRKGGVWLLLDGVDEMGVDSPVQALATIQKQLIDWLTQARTVLTCRLNVWDASVNNTLTGFDTYRTREFKPEQVDQFIEQWFACAEKPQRGEQLQAKLKEPGRERIRDLVKHPLRLALLCQTFYLDKHGELPETKATLYQRFIRYFYEWKQSLHPIDLTTQHELHQALGKLALAGLNSAARFRLRQSIACREMGERLFKLADTLGLLNLIERDTETDEPVYAFFHPCFQEYFAALAVKDWDYFLPRAHDNQNPKPVRDNYRIFDSQWKQVILLWLGREDVGEQEKEEFMTRLIQFEDRCGSFYHRKAYFLAAAGTAEFRNCSNTDKIVRGSIDYSFEEFTAKQHNIITFFNLIFLKKELMEVLIEADRAKLIPALVQSLHPHQHQSIRLLAAMLLLKFDKDNTAAINALIQLIESNGDKLTSLIAVMLLHVAKEDGNKNAIAVDAIVKLIESDSDKLTRMLAAILLDIIDPGNKAAIDIPLSIIENDGNKFTRLLASMVLQLIDGSNKNAVNYLLLQLIPDPDNKFSFVSALSQLSQLREQISQIKKQFFRRSGTGIMSFLTLLYQLTETTMYDEIISVVALILLGKDDSNEKNVAKTVLKSMFEEPLQNLVKEAVETAIRSEKINSSIEAVETAIRLRKISPSIEAVEMAIRSGKINPSIKNDFNTILYSIIDILLLQINEFGESNQGNETALNTVLWLIKKFWSSDYGNKIVFLHDVLLYDVLLYGLVGLIKITENQNIVWHAAESLLKIDPGNETALKALVHLIETTENEGILLQASESLLKIDPGNETALNALVHLIETTENEDILLQAAESLAKIGPGNETVLNAIVNLLKTTENEDILFQAADSLEKILQGDRFPEVVTALKHYMTDQVYKDNFSFYMTCDDILWRYAQTMTYSAFYHAWHCEESCVQALENQFTDIASQLQPTDKTYLIVINAQALEGETDTSAIAQELCNQIYLTAFANEPEIPSVSNAPQLKRLIPQIKKELQKQNLALILNECEPNQELITFCRKLTDILHIGWITNQPLEPPLRGFLPNQPNLPSAIQSWIEEIG